MVRFFDDLLEIEPPFEKGGILIEEKKLKEFKCGKCGKELILEIYWNSGDYTHHIYCQTKECNVDIWKKPKL